MSLGRILVLCSLTTAAFLALVVAGNEAFDTGTTRATLSLPPVTAPNSSTAIIQDATQQSAVTEGAGRDAISSVEALRATDAADTRMTALEAIASLAEIQGLHSESALADAALSHPDPAIREEAVHALGERTSAVALHSLQQSLHDPEARVQEAAVRALRFRNEEAAVSALGPALVSDNPALRMEVVDALGQIGSPAARRTLQQMLADQNDTVREAAAEWLTELAGEDAPRSR